MKESGPLQYLFEQGDTYIKRYLNDKPSHNYQLGDIKP